MIETNIYFLLNQLVPNVLSIKRLTKILISIRDPQINSYERRAYESVDEKSLCLKLYFTKYDEKIIRAQIR